MEPNLPMEIENNSSPSLSPSLSEHGHPTAMVVLNSSPTQPSTAKHNHFAAHDRVGFGNELCKRTKILNLAEFNDKLNEYGCSPIQDPGPPEYHRPISKQTSEQACCDLVNTLIPKCM